MKSQVQTSLWKVKECTVYEKSVSHRGQQGQNQHSFVMLASANIEGG